MKKYIYLIAALFVAEHFSFAGVDRQPSDCVDPNIGTAHSRWFFYTPAACPFGLAKPAPSTDGHLGNNQGWEAVGYDDRHTSIEGFANLHEFQIGGIMMMPTVGKLQTIPGNPGQPETGYRSLFSHANEIAQPGYYKVRLDDYDATAELTSTTRVAFHRYTFPESNESHILFDIGNRLGESGQVIDSYVHIVNSRQVEGFVSTLPEYVKRYQPGAEVKMYFSATLDKDAQSFGVFKREQVFAGQQVVEGPGAGVYLNYETKAGESVTIKVGLSYTSIANARHNLHVEAKNLSFDQALTAAKGRWSEMLGRIRVEGGAEADRTKFYTGLYHALLGRGVASDCNGQYVRNNGSIGQLPCDSNGIPEFQMYNTDAIWGGFWNLTQVWTMAYPDYLSGFVRSQLQQYDDCGWLPDGVAASKFVSGVGTDYMGLVVSAAYLRGIRNFDVEKAYQAVRKNELGWKNRPMGVGKADTRVFVEKGYSPYLHNAPQPQTNPTGARFGASHTLEYSFSAYAASQFAKSLGKTDDYEQLAQLSKGWEILFDSETGFIRPKRPDGSFITPFDPKEVWRGFQEGNAYQYTFYVPQDPMGLISTIGRETFVQRLDSIFQQSEKLGFGSGKEIGAFAGLQNVYNHGNQPSLHIAWLFNYAGEPWLTQKWVRRICNEFYGLDGIHGYGYGQDEDQGQLGAWYVLAGMGLFDVQGGTAIDGSLQLCAPQFDSIHVKLDPNYYPGSEFVIRVEGDPENEEFIKSVQYNDREINDCQLSWADFITGGELVITTSSAPKK